MAVWHVDFQLAPRQALAFPDSPVPGGGWWANAAFPRDYRTRLRAVAPSATSTRNDVEVWGTEEGNRVEVWSVDGRVTRMIVRVDVRRLDSRFGAALLDFVRVAEAVLVRTDGLVVEPNVGTYAAALRTSGAWQFASDPAAFLAAQATTEDDDD